MELSEVIRRRRMVRDFEDRPVPADALDRVLDAGRRAPSAGFSQGFDFVVLEGREQTGPYWDVTLPQTDRSDFFEGITRAPVLILPVTDVQAYLSRYAEPDKVSAGLQREEAWPVRYWDVDTAFATMLLLLAAVDEGLGALFFGIFRNEEQLLATLGVPPGHKPIGTVAIGHRAGGEMAGGSARKRPRRSFDSVVHRGGW
jgi:nitroreductase